MQTPYLQKYKVQMFKSNTFYGTLLPISFSESLLNQTGLYPTYRNYHEVNQCHVGSTKLGLIDTFPKIINKQLATVSLNQVL